MDVLILAGGMAKRLGVIAKNTPKPLLLMGEKPVLLLLLEKVLLCKGISRIIIATNIKFKEHFDNFLLKYNFCKPVEVIYEQDKMGAVGGISNAINQCKIADDLLILGGDNILRFDLNDFVLKAKQFNMPLIALYDIKDKEIVKNRFGVAVLGKDNAIVEFVEKPSEPKSTLVSTACYALPKGPLASVPDFLVDGNNDSLGEFISWLAAKQGVRGYVFEEKWFDIGTPDSLKSAREYLSKFR